MDKMSNNAWKTCAIVTLKKGPMGSMAFLFFFARLEMYILDQISEGVPPSKLHIVLIVMGVGDQVLSEVLWEESGEDKLKVSLKSVQQLALFLLFPHSLGDDPHLHWGIVHLVESNLDFDPVA